MTITRRAAGRPAVTAKATEQRPGTTILFRSGKIRNAVTFDFVLSQVWDLCDRRQMPRPPVPLDIADFWPCILLVLERHNRQTGERIGCLRFLDNDGISFFEQEWQIAHGVTPRAVNSPTRAAAKWPHVR